MLSNLDSDDVEDRSDHNARATSLSLAPAFMFNPEMPSFSGTVTSYSNGAYVTSLALLSFVSHPVHLDDLIALQLCARLEQRTHHSSSTVPRLRVAGLDR